MSSLKDHPAREKVFDLRLARSRNAHHTMTDDYTLFMLYRNKEKVERGEKPSKVSWIQKLLR